MERGQRFRFEIPDSQLAGAYANVLSVWHSPHEFTLDFAVRHPEDPDDESPTVTCLVTARVRIPVSVAFDMLRILNAGMTEYEDRYGQIPTPHAQSAGEEGAAT